MDDLITWLRAQLDDDERILEHARDDRVSRMARAGRTIVADAGMLEEFTRDRLLREVEAKRRILGLVTDAGQQWGDGYTEAYRDVVKLLALPFSDRPGYREEWRF